ncbi:hypothetical protein HC928_22620 [bacterium]|nr:hypothetical protein [bacterium]
MTITLWQSDYYELLETAISFQSLTRQEEIFEQNWQYSGKWGDKCDRQIQLGRGLSLSIDQTIFKEDFVLKLPEREHCLEFTFVISGSSHCNCLGQVNANQNFIFGSGIAPQDILKYPAGERLSRVAIHMEVQRWQELAITSETAGEDSLRSSNDNSLESPANLLTNLVKMIIKLVTFTSIKLHFTCN